jgi:hypothetical protein
VVPATLSSGIAHHIAACRVCRAGHNPVAAQVCHKLDQFGDTSRIRVMNDRFADSEFKQRNGDGPACPACPDQQHSPSFRLSAPICLRLHKGEAIEHAAMQCVFPLSCSNMFFTSKIQFSYETTGIVA